MARVININISVQVQDYKQIEEIDVKIREVLKEYKRKQINLNVSDMPSGTIPLTVEED